MSLFYLFISFFVIANFFFPVDCLEPFTDSVSVSVSVSVIPFPDSGFRIPCFSASVFKREFLCLERFYGRFLHFDIGVKGRPQNVRLKLIFCHVLS